MSATQEPEEVRFYKNVMVLASAVQDGLGKLSSIGYSTIDPMTVRMALALLSSLDKKVLLQTFINNSHEKCWDKIKVRDQSFFIENAGQIFRNLPIDKINVFKDLFTTRDSTGKEVISPDLKQQIWDLFDAMVKISIKYIHRDRSPISYVDNGKVCQKYRASFFDQVELGRHADLWGVQLVYPPQV